MWLTRFAITRPVITAMVFLALAVFGIIAYNQIGRAQNPPGTEFPLVFVSANYPGASPQDMEKLIVKPLEDQLNDLQNVQQVTATAQEGSAEVNVEFKTDTNIDLAAIDVQRRVDTARVFMPGDLDPPFVGKAGSQAPTMLLAVSSNSLSKTELADVVKSRLEPLLKQIPNIQTVTVRGVQTREFHVEPDPGKLLGTNATLGDIFGAVAQNNANVPGGRMDSATKETTVAIHADVNGAADLAAIPLTIPGSSNKLMRVGDVASATDSYADQRFIARYNGQPRVRIQLDKVLTSDEVKETQIVRDQLKIIEPEFPQLTFHEIDAPADYTKQELNGVWQSLIEGIILTAIVMMLFLHAWRNAAVVMISIPTSILATFVVMKWMGFTFDFMSLMGLSLIIGILVDDSIVVLENITRHRDLGEAPMDAAINGRTEIGSAAVAITLVDVIVFSPIAFLPGIVGKYLKEFGLVVVVATLFSLLVSFTLTPLLAGRWSVKKRSQGHPKWLDWLRKPLVNIVVAVAALGFYLIQAYLTPLPVVDGRVAGIILLALLVLNAFVQQYDRILNWYRVRVLNFALAHGFFVVFTCGILLLNALMLMGGGMTSSMLDAFFIVVLVLGLGIGAVYRGAYKTGKLAPVVYHEKGQGVLGIVFTHLRAAFGHRPAGAPRFAAQRNWYRFIVRSAAGMYSNRNMTVATFAVPLALASFMWLFPAISTDFVPGGQTGTIRMSLTYPVGTPITVTDKGTNAVSDAIQRIDGIETVSSTVGYKSTGFGQTTGGNYATLSADTYKNRRKEQNKIMEKVRKLAYLAPGANFQVAGESGGGSGTPIFYALTGPDADLDGAAKKIVTFLRATPGSVNVQSGAEGGAPRLNVQVDAGKAAVLGVSPGAAAQAARLAVAGGVATKVRTGDGLVDVRVAFPKAKRDDVTNLENVRIRASDGSLVPLGSVATFSWTKAPTKIDRLDRARVINVTGSVLPGYSLGAVTGPLEQKLHEPGFLPAGVHLKPQGDTQLMIDTFTNMGLALVMSFMLVYMLMVILYGSFLEPLIVMCSVPMAIVGALFGLSFMHFFDQEGTQSLNIISMIGIIMLFGLVAKNGILLVDYSNTLHRKRGLRVRDATLQASGTRFRPILMTTFAMVFGMLPLALGFAEGSEWRQAIGTVIIGGLISSLILTLFLVPMIYNTWMGFFERVGDEQAVVSELQPSITTGQEAAYVI
ncbi:MAG: efflux RND transporter permease subunit [Candidatus Baltobacteraceae bacterium]